MIDSLISQRSRGNPILKATTTTKLILRGIDPARYTLTSNDDREVIEKLRAVAAEMDVQL